MVPNANARHFLLKAKQRDLITAAGGIERAAGICSYSKSVVGRWFNSESPEIMELPAIFALEEETGRFDMSEAIAQTRGRRFAEVEAAPVNGCVMSSHAEVIVQLGELATEGAIAFSDGLLTPSESKQLDQKLAKAANAIDGYREVLAGGRAAGGLSIVAGGAK